MKYIDMNDLKSKTLQLLDYIETENVVITKDGNPVAIMQSITEHGHFIGNQYSAMMNVWGDPACDAYDEAFMDE